MPTYTYTATSLQGEKVSGTEVAKSEHELAGILHKQGYILTSAETEDGGRGGGILSMDFLSNFRGIPISEKLLFTRNLQVMITAGVPLPKSLDILAKQTKNKKFQKAIVGIQEQVVKGRALSEAMEQHPGVFSELFINMIKAGEESGTMENVLSHLAEQMERSYEIQSKVKGALIYPAVIVSAMFVIGAFMLAFVVPNLAKIFDDLGVDLPLTTRVIIMIGTFLSEKWFIALPAFLIFVVVLFRLVKTKAGKRALDTVFLRAPVLSGIIRKMNTALTARTLSSLLAAGIPIVSALEITSHVVGNTHFKHALTTSAGQVQKGIKFSEALKPYEHLYPSMIIQMVEVGEETGETTSVLAKLAAFYEGEVNNITKNLASIIEPVLMLIIGGVVGFFAISMFQPMYSILGSIQ